MTNATFQVGNTYEMSWVTNSDAKNACKVLKRTKCFVTLDVERWGVQRCKVHQSPYGSGEFCMPLGSYSMAPCVGADDLIAEA